MGGFCVTPHDLDENAQPDHFTGRRDGILFACRTSAARRQWVFAFGNMAPMKRSLTISLLIAGFVAGLGAGFVGGCRHQQFNLALQENKVAAANLKANTDFYRGTNLSPQLREFLKARIYCNVYNCVNSDL
jgi:hypothetical protein